MLQPTAVQAKDAAAPKGSRKDDFKGSLTFPDLLPPVDPESDLLEANGYLPEI